MEEKVMTINTDQIAESTVPAQDELTVLKARAATLGIKHHPSIGLDKLKAKVNGALSDTPTEVAEDIMNEDQGVLKELADIPETELQMISRLRREATQLQRVVIACMNPQKKEWEGEIFTVGNSAVGSIKKYVPFNNDEGWHVPKMLLNMITERKCQIFVNGKIPPHVVLEYLF
jgi:hypothetical protein